MGICNLCRYYTYNHNFNKAKTMAVNVNKNFLYGLSKLSFGDKEVGWIEKDSFDFNGKQPESVDINAEQVPDAPVMTLPQSNGTIAPKFSVIQLNYINFALLLGGKLIKKQTGDPDAEATGWEAPKDLIQLSGAWTIETPTGKKIEIPNGTLISNLGGKLSLKEVAKLECQLNVLKPENDDAPYSIKNMK